MPAPRQEDRCPECHAEYGGHFKFPPCPRDPEPGKLAPQFHPIPHKANRPTPERSA